MQCGGHHQRAGKGARAAGALVFQNLPVTAIRTGPGGVTGVATEHGDIDVDCVVLCTGMWTRALAATIGVNVPLHACEHYYALFESVAGLDANFPVVRDYDACTYYKYDAGKAARRRLRTPCPSLGRIGHPRGLLFR